MDRNVKILVITPLITLLFLNFRCSNGKQLINITTTRNDSLCGVDDTASAFGCGGFIVFKVIDVPKSVLIIKGDITKYKEDSAYSYSIHNNKDILVAVDYFAGEFVTLNYCTDVPIITSPEPYNIVIQEGDITFCIKRQIDSTSNEVLLISIELYNLRFYNKLVNKNFSLDKVTMYNVEIGKRAG